MYCGLFTSFYLISFGVSSIILNHQMKVEKQTVEWTWDDQVTVESFPSDRELAENIRDQLGLMGWTPPWEYQKDSTRFQFVVTHLAKNTNVKVDLDSGRAAVVEKPKGFWAVLHGMHFFNGRIPNAPFFLQTWMVFQWLTLLVLFLSLILGLWLWLKYSYKTWELYVFGGLFILSFLTMILL